MTAADATSTGLGPAVLVTLVLGSSCAAAGTLLLKLGAAGNASLMDFVNLRLAGGLGLYGLGSALWIYALARAPLSVVYPFNALTFVLVMAAGVLVLGERPTLAMLAGSGLILSGIGCFALGAAR